MTKQYLSLITLLLMFVTSACTGLAGEPDIVATARPRPTQVVEEDPLYPQSQPDIENGALIFAQHCTDCHGVNGNGQGNLVQEGSIPQPPDMTDITQTTLDTPLQWYETITNGNIEKLMPPWQNALSMKQRWDVAYYAYTLGYSNDMLTLGQSIWDEQCGDCEAVNALINLQESVSLSDAGFGNKVDREDFGSTLSPDEIRAAVAYARSLSVDNRGSIAFIPDTIPEREAPDAVIGNFTGTVQQGTAGSNVPPDTVIQMQYGNARDGFEFVQTTINPDNTFVFENIPLTNSYNYNVGAVYRERLFTTTLLEGHPEDIGYDQTITIYDLTDDPFVINISRIDMFIDSINVPDVGSGLRVTEVIRYNNSSDRMYTTGRDIGDGREATLLIQFPVGALITSNEANGRYIIIDDIENIPDSVIDTYPIVPGENHEVIVEYFVPYVDGAIIDQPFANAIDGEVTITISDNLEVVSDTFTLSQEGTNDENLRVYAGNLKVESDPQLVFEVSGTPFTNPAQNETVIPVDSLFPLLLIVVVLIVGFVLGFIIINSRGNKNAQAVDRLIQQIAELDDMHENGLINHDLYQQQRQELKEQLTRLMQDKPVS